MASRALVLAQVRLDRRVDRQDRVLVLPDTHGLGRRDATEIPRGAPGMSVGVTVAVQA
jgi:hypothetical protein